MIKRPNTKAQRVRRHQRVRGKVSGTAERPVSYTHLLTVAVAAVAVVAATASAIAVTAVTATVVAPVQIHGARGGAQALGEDLAFVNPDLDADTRCV